MTHLLLKTLNENKRIQTVGVRCGTEEDPVNTTDKAPGESNHATFCGTARNKTSLYSEGTRLDQEQQCSECSLCSLSRDLPFSENASFLVQIKTLKHKHDYVTI